MQLKILLDLDGVIYDWMGSALPIFNVDANNKENRKILKTYHDGLEMIRSKQEVFETIENKGSEFWAELKLFPWANELYNNLSEIGEVTILTSPGYWTLAGKGKLTALKRDFEIKNFILAKNKEVCAMPNAILIDDKKKNVANFRNAGGWSYLWPNSFCIQDKEPEQSQAISDCVKYVKLVKQKIEDRKTFQIMNILSHDNNRDEDLSEK